MGRNNNKKNTLAAVCVAGWHIRDNIWEILEPHFVAEILVNNLVEFCQTHCAT